MPIRILLVALLAAASIAGSRQGAFEHHLALPPIKDCVTVATNPPVGGYNPSVTVCKP
ncbi:MAG TPA: hypothetical protein VNG13_00605 [Mycobacteriales bacterium]|nr:hypothetical protein [Mycobacteriales bacterium]HVB42565.1 hypothetical protein [Streptosporangiaceae bacterium]